MVKIPWKRTPMTCNGNWLGSRPNGRVWGREHGKSGRNGWRARCSRWRMRGYLQWQSGQVTKAISETKIHDQKYQIVHASNPHVLKWSKQTAATTTMWPNWRRTKVISAPVWLKIWSRWDMGRVRRSNKKCRMDKKFFIAKSIAKTWLHQGKYKWLRPQEKAQRPRLDLAGVVSPGSSSPRLAEADEPPRTWAPRPPRPRPREAEMGRALAPEAGSKSRPEVCRSSSFKMTNVFFNWPKWRRAPVFSYSFSQVFLGKLGVSLWTASMKR